MGGRRVRRHAGGKGPAGPRVGKNKKRWKDTVGSGSRFQKVELSHVSGRGNRARKSQRERKRELGEARRMEVVGPTYPRSGWWMEETKGEAGGGRGGRGGG